jgi:protein-S-isoprenylcysteine O-methyltransferase Ste14
VSIANPRLELVPPPVLFFAVFAVGLAAQHALTGVWIAPPGPFRAAGAIVAAAGLCVIFSGAATVLLHGTTIIPHRTPSALVRRGPFTLTRNPMYVGLTIFYIGAMLWTGAWAAGPLLIIPVLFMDRVIIPMEERHLREAFGDAYEKYRAAVRRWI